MREFWRTKDRGRRAEGAATAVRGTLTVLAAAALAATALVATTTTSQAGVIAGGGRNPDRTPNYVRDSKGLALRLCTDEQNCELPDPADAEAFGTYFTAEASLGPMRATWGIEAEFMENAQEQLTDQAGLSNSALFRAEGLRPNRRYTIRGPWGRHRCRTDNRGRLDNKNCAFSRGGEAGGRLRAGPVKSLLRARVAPRGFVGNSVVPQRVVGSPSGFNRVTLRGPGARFGTSRFVLGGQMAADTPMAEVSRTRMRLGNRNNTRNVSKLIRIRSVGTAPVRFRIRKFGDKGAFKVREGCGRLRPGRVCKVRVTHRPVANRDKRAVLRINDNTLAPTRRVRLFGTAPR